MRHPFRVWIWASVVVAFSATGCQCGSKPNVAVDDPEPDPVVSRPVIPVDAGPTMKLCAGSSARIGPAPQSGRTYAWTPADGLDDPTAAQPLAAPTATTTYTVSVNDPSTNGRGSAQVTVQVRPLPTAVISAIDGQAAAPTAVCSGASWGASAGASSAAEGASVTGYAWSFSDGTTADGLLAYATAAGPGPLGATLTVTDSEGCQASTTAEVAALPLPSVSTGPDAMIGPGGATQLLATSAGAGAYTFQWTASDPACADGSCLSDPTAPDPYVSLQTSSDFSVAVTDAQGCVSPPASMRVTVTGPVIPNPGAETGVCLGGSVAIGGPASGGVAPYTYDWTSGDCSAAGCAGEGESITVSPTVTTVYTQRAFDLSGSKGSASITVNVSPDPGSAGSDRWIDPGSSATFGPDAIANASYAWSCNRADCALVDPSSSRATASPIQSTRYTLDATSGIGCAPSSSMVVWVHLQPTSVPATGETAYPVSSALEVLFDRPISPASLTSSSVYIEDAVSGARIPVATSLDASGKLLTVTPPTAGTNGYQAGNDYTLIVLSGASGVVSDDPVLPNVLGSDLMIDFTTSAADTTGPGLSFRSPTVNATGVPLNTQVVGLFNEPIDPSSISDANVALVCGGSPVAGTLGYDLVGRTFQLVPSAALPPTTSCTVTLISIRDLSGNTSTISWSFTTGAAPDLDAPTVVSLTPADGAIGISATASMTAVFSEAIDSTTLASTLSLTRADDGTRVSGIVSYNPNTLTATFTPQVALEGSTEYRFTVSGTRDLAGNAMVVSASAQFLTMRTLFSDTFENGTGKWTLDAASSGVSWGLSTWSFRSATHSLTDSPSGKYGSNLVSIAKISQELDTTGVPQVFLQFAARVRTEKNRDYFFVDYSVDGGTNWTQLGKSGGLTGWNGNSGWALNALTIPTGGASSMLIRFRLTSSTNKNFDGVYLDDVLIQAP